MHAVIVDERLSPSYSKQVVPIKLLSIGDSRHILFSLYICFWFDHTMMVKGSVLMKRAVLASYHLNLSFFLAHEIEL